MTIIALIVAALLVVIDQVIKLAVVNNIDLYQSIDVIKFGNHKIFNLTHILNDGAGWSIFSGKTYFLIAITSLFLIVVLVYLFINKKNSKLLMISLSMIIAGGIGNLIDRVFREGKVIDYIQTMFMDFPIFNFADICVVIGAILLIVYMLFFEDKNTKDLHLKKD